MTPNDALILRAQTHECWLRQLDKKGTDHLRKREGGEFVIGMGACEAQLLGHAPLYTWRTDLLRAAIHASASLPRPVTLTSDMMPSESGLYLFDVPQCLDGSVPIVACGWYPLGDYVAVFIYRPTQGTKWSSWGPIIAFANFILKRGHDVMARDAVDMRREDRASFDQNVGAEAVVRFLLASWLWMNQRVMTHACATVSSKAKKLARRASIAPSVSVVVLRRSERAGSVAVAGESSREYSCQWFVRGHWRLPVND